LDLFTLIFFIFYREQEKNQCKSVQSVQSVFPKVAQSRSIMPNISPQSASAAPNRRLLMIPESQAQFVRV
jgi:hypothetical protein